jgi:hypothetical protein
MDTDSPDSSNLHQSLDPSHTPDDASHNSNDLLADTADSQSTTLNHDNNFSHSQTTYSTFTNSQVTDSSTTNDNTFMDSLQDSQPVPRATPHVLPDDLIHFVANPSVAAELEVLLQQVPTPFLPYFYDLVHSKVPTSHCHT